MPVSFPQIHNQVYLITLAICAMVLPLSVFAISICLVVLMLNWLLEKSLYERWQKIKTTKSLWFIGLFYAVHLIGLINTSDFKFAFHDLHIKLPFLILPLIIGTSNEIAFKWLRFIFISFIIGVFVSTFYSFLIIINTTGDIMSQMLTISPFIWHIRLSIMVVFAIFIIPWLFQSENSKLIKSIYCLLVVWFIAFLFVLQSLTGILIFLLLTLLISLYFIGVLKNTYLRYLLVLPFMLVMIYIPIQTIAFYKQNFAPRQIDINQLDKYTVNGNVYHHHPIHTNVENGNFVDIYICDKELEKEWPKRSKLNLDSNDKNQNNIRRTLIRYLTSKGLRKDSTGIAMLTTNDIRNIENGVANELFVKKAGLTSRVYRTMWELYHYSNGANPSGYSVAMRIEYYKTSLRIIQRNFWFGTGTGDVLKEFQNQYNIDHSKLEQKWRLRAHNQFITFLLTFGILGFLIICAALFVPPFLEKKYKTYLFGVFFFIIVMSMLGDDTLETHAAITFFALFYSILLFNTTSITTYSEKNRD